MPIFARRRLCSMLDDLFSLLPEEKVRDLDKRLQHTDSKTALGAEAELMVLWGVSQVAQLTPEPKLPESTRRPDAFSDNLFASSPSIIEVRALSDESFSGKEAMDRAANIVAGYVDSLRKKSGDHLYFEFLERSYWEHGQYHRERCVDPKFQLTDEIRLQLRNWISCQNWEASRIRITQGKTDVVVSWRNANNRLFRTFCRMPAIAYDREDNPVYKALKKKSHQLKGAGSETLRCVALVDMGCGILRRLVPLSPLHEIGGADIIRHALNKLSIDSVIVLSPFRQDELSSYRTTMLWNVTFFDNRNIDDSEYRRWQKLAAVLPRPRVAGYQARSMHVQGMFEENSLLNFLPSTIITNRGSNMTIKLSAGLLHKYLAGGLSEEEFRNLAFANEHNLFASEMMRGNSIRSASLEPGGIDKDDDYVVFELDVDPKKSINVPQRTDTKSND